MDATKGPWPSPPITCGSEALTFTSGGNTVTVTLNTTNGDTIDDAVKTLNSQLSSLGISAVEGTGGDIEFQSGSSFSVTKGLNGAAGVFAATTTSTTQASANNPSTIGLNTSASLAAVTAVGNAVKSLGLVQGRVGAGENTLQYAIDLANSQTTNFSSAESQIRDADVATEAANLTKAQVLEQASVAAMAQANSSPQYVLKLLQG